MGDTRPDVADRYRAMMMARTPEERLRMASRMLATARTLILAGAGAVADAAGRELIFSTFYAGDFDALDRRRIVERLSLGPRLASEPTDDDGLVS